jgi:hypothetical protein
MQDNSNVILLPPLLIWSHAMRFLLFLTFVALQITINPNLFAQANSESKAIKDTFAKYLASDWPKKKEFMTEEAYIDYTMSILVANKAIAETEIQELGIKDYKFLNGREDYRSLPKEPAIRKAIQMRKAMYKELKDKLGEKFDTLVESVFRKSNKAKVPSELSEVTVSDDGLSATAECKVEGVDVLIPMKFRKSEQGWQFDGKDELKLFDRLR